jgi:ribonuclease P/MRP protein subunit POP5
VGDDAIKDDFLKFHAPSPTKFDERNLVYLIRNAVTELFGDYGIGKITGSLKGQLWIFCHRRRLIQIAVIYLSTATSSAIVRVSRDHVRLVWAALSFITKLPKPFEIPCVIHVVRNSGTIRLAEDEAINRAREFVRRARSVNTGPGLDQVLKSAVEAEINETGESAMHDDDMSDGD